MGGTPSKSVVGPGEGSVTEVAPGVTLKTLKAGDGKTFPRNGQAVRVHYTGTLDDGAQFDSSRDRKDPFDFPVGAGQVIKCWDKAVMAMSLGERAMLTCSPENAYGSRPIGPIPANSTLHFDVELLKLF
ncbi:12 kDa FK506-binding protein [Diplonema papillatum]|nr:12 kDa FK506-binding protein [Diplonema papillatum]